MAIGPQDVPGLARILQPGEQVLWIGKPNRHRFAMHAWFWLLVLLGLILGVGSLVRSLLRDRVSMTATIGVSAGAVALGIVSAVIAYAVRYAKSGSRAYVATNLRVLELRTGGAVPVILRTWGDKSPLHFIEVKGEGEPVGSVLVQFVNRAGFLGGLDKWEWLPTRYQDGLIGIDDPDGVAALLGAQRYGPDAGVGAWVDEVPAAPPPANRRPDRYAAGGAAPAAVSPDGPVRRVTITPNQPAREVQLPGQRAPLSSVQAPVVRAASRAQPMQQDSLPVELQRFLAEGERVLWWSRPDPAKYNSAGSALLMPILLLCAALLVGGAVYILMNLFGGSGPAADSAGFSPWITLSLLVGILAGTVFYYFRRKHRRNVLAHGTLYAVTNVQALIVFPEHRNTKAIVDPFRCHEFRAERIGPLKVVRKGTWGHLILSTSEKPSDVSKENIAFLAIQNPEQVAKLIRSLPWAARVGH